MPQSNPHYSQENTTHMLQQVLVSFSKTPNHQYNDEYTYWNEYSSRTKETKTSTQPAMLLKVGFDRDLSEGVSWGLITAIFTPSTAVTDLILWREKR